MITQATIDQVKDLNIVDILSQYIEVKKKGTSYQACCPFHDERTPSFHINEARQYYKCFGCGEAGDAIAFVMKHLRLDFEEAIREIAKSNNIRVEETNADSGVQAKKKNSILLVAGSILEIYKGKISVCEKYLEERGVDDGDRAVWGLGWSPAGNELTRWATSNNFLQECTELGLVLEKDGRHYDFFRERLMFPIHNEKGQVISFAGRIITPADNTPKYLNGKESTLYNKSKVLYGLHLAGPHIRKAGFAVLVEGYTDVISFHRAGVNNTVATCGTALTADHCKLLKKYTANILLVRDGDNAGRKALLKDIELCFAAGMEARVYELSDGQDPDDFAREFLNSLIAAG